MNEDKLTAQEVMQETGQTFCKYNEEATRKETEAAVDYVLNLYRQQLRALNEFLDKTEFIQDTAHFSELGMHRADVIRKRFEQADAREKYLSEKLKAAYEEIDEQARLLGMSAERELSLLAEIEQLKKIINKLVAQNPSESLISLLLGRTKGQVASKL